MSALTSAQVATGLAALPRVDLLPPEIGDGVRLRKVQAGLALAVVLSVGAVGLVTAQAAGGVSDGRTDLATAVAEQARVQRDVDGLRDVTAVYASVTAAQAALRTAMGGEVRYSAMLDDLARAVPGDVWLTNAAYAETGSAAGSGAGGARAAGPAGPALTPSSGSVGSLALTGVALTHDAVAAWLDVLAKRTGLGLPVLQNEVEATVGGHVVVNWTISVPVTDAALSKRYTTTGS